MPISAENDCVSTLRRVFCWFASFLLVVLPFSLLFGSAMGAVGLVLRITLIISFPVWCLFLPFIIRFKDANGRRGAILLLGGSLSGPAAIFVLSLLTAGENYFWEFWSGDPEEGMGTGYYMVLAFIVGSLISAVYVLFLKFALSRHSAAKSV